VPKQKRSTTETSYPWIIDLPKIPKPIGMMTIASFLALFVSLLIPQSDGTFAIFLYVTRAIFLIACGILLIIVYYHTYLQRKKAPHIAAWIAIPILILFGVFEFYSIATDLISGPQNIVLQSISLHTESQNRSFRWIPLPNKTTYYIVGSESGKMRKYAISQNIHEHLLSENALFENVEIKILQNSRIILSCEVIND